MFQQLTLIQMAMVAVGLAALGIITVEGVLISRRRGGEPYDWAAFWTTVRINLWRAALHWYGGMGIIVLVVAILPLVLTSILAEALMVALGMGVKVATLPVIALGVGIGVDYALYLLSVQLHYQRQGRSLGEAYQNAVAFTGRVVGLVGITLAAGVVGWAWSPIKFQADMGILLTFMFLWNMLGALILIPALSYFLLRERVPAVAPVTPAVTTETTERPGVPHAMTTSE